MDVRKTVTLVEEINREYGTPAKLPLRRVAIAAVLQPKCTIAATRSSSLSG